MRFSEYEARLLARHRVQEALRRAERTRAGRLSGASRTEKGVGLNWLMVALQTLVRGEPRTSMARAPRPQEASPRV